MWENLLTDADQESGEKYALNYDCFTLMYYPKQRLERANLFNTFFAFTPLSMKKYNLKSVVSTKTLGTSYRIELILLIQFLQISCADSGMFAPFKSEIVIYFILSSGRLGKLSFFILSNTFMPNYSTISIT